MDYVDLYLIHSFTIEGITLEDAWKAMEKTKDMGLAKEIGVSNYRIEDLTRTLGIAKHKPLVNQIEMHPYLRRYTFTYHKQIFCCETFVTRII